MLQSAAVRQPHAGHAATTGALQGPSRISTSPRSLVTMQVRPKPCLPGLGSRGCRVQRRTGKGWRRNSAVVTAGWLGGDEKDKTVADKAEETTTEEDGGTKKKYSKLLVAVVVDVIGLLADKQFLDLDFGWSPVAAFIIQRMYRAPLLTAVGFVEQAVPGFKFLPTATLGWVAESVPQLEWITQLPFMGALGKAKPKGGLLGWWPFGEKKE